MNGTGHLTIVGADGGEVVQSTGARISLASSACAHGAPWRLSRRRSTLTLDPMKTTTVALLLFAAHGAAAAATDYTSDATVLATFECPEALKDDAARRAASRDFSAWVHRSHPDWTAAKLTGYRLYVLEKHHCDKSIAAMRADAAKHQ